MKKARTWIAVTIAAVVIAAVWWPRSASTFEPKSAFNATLPSGSVISARFLNPITIATKSGDILRGVTVQPISENGLLICITGTPVSGKVLDIKVKGSTATVTAILNELTCGSVPLILNTKPTTVQTNLVSQAQLLARATEAVIGGAVGQALGVTALHKDGTAEAAAAADAASAPDEKSEMHATFELREPVSFVLQ